MLKPAVKLYQKTSLFDFDKAIIKNKNEKIVFSHYLSYNSLFTTYQQ